MAVRSCRQCSQGFEVTRGWQAFCGNKCRVAWHRENTHCFYCGAHGATDRDHIYPVALRGSRSFEGQETVKACGDCNGALGGRSLDLEERIAFLMAHVVKKYKLHETAVQWSDEEIAELGPILRRRIKRFLAKRKQGEERILYLQYLAEYVAAFGP